MAAFLGSTDHWLWESAAGDWLCRAAECLDQSTVLDSTHLALKLTMHWQVAQNSFEVQGAHLILVLYICALSSSSHLAALINLRKYFRKYKLIAKIRLTIFVFFRHLHLRIHVSRHRHAANSHLTRERHKQGEQSSSAAGLPSTYALHSCRLLTALVCILYDPDRKSAASKAASDSSGSIVQLVRHLTDQKPHTPSCSPQFMLLPAYFGLRLVYSLFLNPLIAFTVQILLAILSAVLVLTQKFAQPDNQRAFCGLQHEGENVWGFGQTLSVAMLLLPVLSARHTYLKGQQDIRDG